MMIYIYDDTKIGTRISLTPASPLFKTQHIFLLTIRMLAKSTGSI